MAREVKLTKAGYERLMQQLERERELEGDRQVKPGRTCVKKGKKGKREGRDDGAEAAWA